MASVCNFVKPFFVGVPLKYYLNCDVRQKFSFRFNPGLSIFARNPCTNIHKVLKEILTYNCLGPCPRGSFIQPVFTTPLLFSSISENHVQRQKQSSVLYNTTRSYSTNKPSFPTMVNFTDLPVISGPGFFKSIRNWVLSTFIMRMHLDQEYNSDEFVDTTAKAVQLICARLSQSDYANVEGLLTDKLLAKIKEKLSTCSIAQRLDLAFNIEDIILQYIYEIGIIFDENNETSEGEPKRFVEITVCYHISKGFSDIMSKMMSGEGESPTVVIKAELEKNFIINCRFIREYTKGVEDQWTINAFNYFCLGDIDKLDTS